MVEMIRRSPLDGRGFESERVKLVPGAFASRVILRAEDAAVAPLSKVLELDLPRAPKATAGEKGRFALWLGPDEWLVIDEEGADLVEACAGVAELHSAVDVSHRNVALRIEGPAAKDVLAAGCPQDLSPPRFPVGAASRTVFGKAEVIVWRRGERDFHVECWRSFADYVFMLMETASREA